MTTRNADHTQRREKKKFPQVCKRDYLDELSTALAGGPTPRKTGITNGYARDLWTSVVLAAGLPVDPPYTSAVTRRIH
jgi:hypothetical protein